MVRDKEFWREAIDLGSDYEPNYDVATIEGIGRVATVDYDLAITDNLIKLADEIRVAKGYEPLWNNWNSDGWYNFYVWVEDVDGGRLHSSIYCTANNTPDDDYAEYYIDFTEEEAKWIYEALDNAIRYWSNDYETIETHLEIARGLLKY